MQQNLQSVNMEIGPGETVCFTGDEASGKRQIIRALLGDLEDYEGSVFLDGYNIKSGFDAIKEQISFVGSDPTLFDGTILDNLTMFQPDIDLDFIFNTTTLIGLDEHINRLPYGYHTKLGGNNNFSVSPGIHQKIAIARTLIRCTPVIVLENITMNLDEKDKHRVSKGLHSIKGQSTILISDQSSELIKLCDRIFIFQEGKLIGQHKHAELLEEA